MVIADITGGNYRASDTTFIKISNITMKELSEDSILNPYSVVAQGNLTILSDVGKFESNRSSTSRLYAGNKMTLKNVNEAYIEAPNLIAESISNSTVATWNATIGFFDGEISPKRRDGYRLSDDNVEKFVIKITGDVVGQSLINAYSDYYLNDTVIDVDLSEMGDVIFNGGFSLSGRDPAKLTIRTNGRIFIPEGKADFIDVRWGGSTIVTDDPNLDLNATKNTHGWWRIKEVKYVTDLEAAVKAAFEAQ